MKRKSKKQLLVTLCLLLTVLMIFNGSIFLSAQAGFGIQTYNGTVTDTIIGYPFPGVTVTVYKGSTVYDVDITDANGHYFLYVEVFVPTYVTIKFKKDGVIKTVGKTARPSGVTTVNVAIENQDLATIIRGQELATDWGRHPTDNRIKDLAEDILLDANGENWPSLSDRDKALCIHDYVKNKWYQYDPVIKSDIDVYNSYTTGTENFFDDVGVFVGRCYSCANFLSGLYRAIGLPSRIIVITIKKVAAEHAFTEVKVDGEWIPVCGAYPVYGWFGWKEFQTRGVENRDWKWSNPDWPSHDVDWVHLVWKVNGNYQQGGVPIGWDEVDRITHYENDIYDPIWTTWSMYDYRIAENQ